MGVFDSLIARTSCLLGMTSYIGCGFDADYDAYLCTVKEQLKAQYGDRIACEMLERFALMCREFPCLANRVKFQVKEVNPRAAAVATFGKSVILAPIHIQTYINDSFINGQQERANSKEYRHLWESYMAHELGHILEGILIDKRFAGRTAEGDIRSKKVHQWNKRIQATRIIRKACDLTREECPDLRNKTNDELVAMVSDYATTNRSEALAECVMDYSGNRSFAKPLSIRVWRLLKQELCGEGN